MNFWRVPLDADKIQITKGTVVVLEDRCKGCGYCIEFCPRDVLTFSSRFNIKGYHPPEVVCDDCVNCHYCEIICPEFAIYSIEAIDKTMDEMTDEGDGDEIRRQKGTEG